MKRVIIILAALIFIIGCAEPYTVVVNLRDGTQDTIPHVVGIIERDQKTKFVVDWDELRSVQTYVSYADELIKTWKILEKSK